MTVAELIAELEKYPGNMEVLVSSWVSWKPSDIGWTGDYIFRTRSIGECLPMQYASQPRVLVIRSEIDFQQANEEARE